MRGARHADGGTIPARALAGLVDLDVLEAAVLEVKNEPPRVPESAVFLPEGQGLNAVLEAALRESLPEGPHTASIREMARPASWSSGRGDTREAVNAALASLGRPPLD
jgi:hypothetical protein